MLHLSPPLPGAPFLSSLHFSPDVARQHGFYAMEQDKDMILALIARLRHERHVIIRDVRDRPLIQTARTGSDTDGLSSISPEQIFYVL
jgi:hypothetical protein